MTPTPERRTAAEAIAANRRAKAAKIHAALLSQQITSVGNFTEQSWDYAAMLAGYSKDEREPDKPLVSPETKGYVLEMFEGR